MPGDSPVFLFCLIPAFVISAPDSHCLKYGYFSVCLDLPPFFLRIPLAILRA